MEERT